MQNKTGKMLRKIPRYIINRWMRIVDQRLYGTDNDPNFEGLYAPLSVFAKFLSSET